MLLLASSLVPQEPAIDMDGLRNDSVLYISTDSLNTLNMDSLIEIAEEYAKFHPDSVGEIADNVIDIAEKSNFVSALFYCSALSSSGHIKNSERR